MLLSGTRNNSIDQKLCPAVPGGPPRSHTFPYHNLSYIVGSAVLNNGGRPEVSRTRTDRLFPSRPAQCSWQSPRWALRGPRAVENTVRSSQEAAENVLPTLRLFWKT